MRQASRITESQPGLSAGDAVAVQLCLGYAERFLRQSDPVKHVRIRGVVQWIVDQLGLDASARGSLVYRQLVGICERQTFAGLAFKELGDEAHLALAHTMGLALYVLAGRG